jgi:SOS-response transcriptional repressor LexA
MDNNTTSKVASTENVAFDPTNLRAARKSLRYTQQEVADLLDIHRTYYVLVEKGYKNPSAKLRHLIDTFVAKSAQQPVRRPTIDLHGGVKEVGRLMRAVQSVPVISWASAGRGKDFDDLDAQLDEQVSSDCRDTNAFAIILEGDSMEPSFFAGDRVVFMPNSEPRNGDAVLARLNDGGVLFKRYLCTGPEGTRIRLTSENPNYSPIELKRADFRFIYPAYEVKRLLRR